MSYKDTLTWQVSTSSHIHRLVGGDRLRHVLRKRLERRALRIAAEPDGQREREREGET